MPAQILETEISAIGNRGDGIAETEEGRFYIPFTVPGDRLLLTIQDGGIIHSRRTADGPDRCTPVCSHFGECGGCALQHVDDVEYSTWMHKRVTQALALHGLYVKVDPPIRIPPGTRRRARLGVRSTAKGVVLGFKAKRSHWLVDVTECPIVHTEIVALLPQLRTVLSYCLEVGGGAEVSVAIVDSGLDVAVDTSSVLDLAKRERLAEFAASSKLARLTWAGELVVQRHLPCVVFAEIAVHLPIGVFLQPTKKGELVLTEFVATALDSATTVADLFAGCGAFSLPLAIAGKRVHAVDVDNSQISALNAAAQGPRLGARITAETRDLERRPLAGSELTRFDGLVLDPPRAGAVAQIREIAAMAISVGVYASCNPATFARDARTLFDGGYNLGMVTPIDQFVWSAEIELVAVFRR